MSKKYYLFFVLVICVVMISACAQRQQTAISPGQVPQESEQKQPQENVEDQQPIPVQQIPPEIKELFEKSKTRVKSAYYKYRGPETGSNFYEFYVKDAKIKYKPHVDVKTFDQPESYDSVFIDKVARTAASYCEAAYCAYKGKKQSLNYEQAYIMTILDWIEVEQAKKVGEEVIDSRSTWKLETNLGILWIDTFYGIPLRVESNGKTYRFEQFAANSVQDSDVTPTS